MGIMYYLLRVVIIGRWLRVEGERMQKGEKDAYLVWKVRVRAVQLESQLDIMGDQVPEMNASIFEQRLCSFSP